MNKIIHGHLERIFAAGVEKVKPRRLVTEYVRLSGRTLTLPGTEIDLAGIERIVVYGAGKASASMALGLEEAMGGRITRGIVSVKRGHTEKLDLIELVEAGHPLPDENSLKAGRVIGELVREADGKTLLMGLISGGGSALLVDPFSSGDTRLTFEDITRTTDALLRSGADIREMNCVRKHLSNIKGGRLAAAGYPALRVNLILSDVVGDGLDDIASGLTTHDTTTWADALGVVERYGLHDKIPENVLGLLRAGVNGAAEETPKEGDERLAGIINILLGTNATALHASCEKARELGYDTVALSSQITGEAREVAKVLAGIARDTGKKCFMGRKPVCVLWGGETTVTVRGAGKGGRNQELALAFLRELDLGKREENIYLLSASTDGNDGPTDAAGAFASARVLKEADALGLDIDRFLQSNDSYTFFEKSGGLLKTGPTNTNVCDLQILIVT